jgi:hypothetical protein
MRCINSGKIRAYLDNELAEKEKVSIEMHLKKCEGCQRILRDEKNNLQYVRSRLKLIDPPSVPQLTPDIRIEPVKMRFSIKNLFHASVRIPAVALIILGFIVLFMSFMLFAKEKISITYIYPRSNETKEDALTFSTDNFIQLIPLNTEIKDFKPIQNPHIFVLKEVGEK